MAIRGEVRVCGSTFEEFFRDEYKPLVAFLRKHGFGQEQAEDAAQEAMACACKDWYRVDQSARGWVYKVAYRSACIQARRSRQEVLRAIVGGWVTSTRDDGDVVEAEERDEVLRVLGQLPLRQRLVMIWHLAGFDTNEISEGLGMRPATVRSTLRHAKDRIRKIYQNRIADSGREEVIHG